MTIISKRAAVAGVVVAAAASVGLVAQASAAPVPVPSPAGTAGVGGNHLYAFYAVTTTTQRHCLAQQGLTAPQGRLTDDQRAALRRAVEAAAGTCGVRLPERPLAVARVGLGFARLTPTQQACVADIQVTRPIGRLTDAQKATLKSDVDAAVAACVK